MPHRKKTVSVKPRGAVAGARVTVELPHFDLQQSTLPEVRIAGAPARVVFASEHAVAVIVPEDIDAGAAPVTVDGTEGEAELYIGTPVAADLHQVDNPVFDRHANLYVTNSGRRGERVPVSIFRVAPDGTQEPFVSGIVNATSMTLGPDGRLYVSSRFEGKVYRIEDDGRAAVVGSDLGVACGLAFFSDGALLVGDRSGTVLRLDVTTGTAGAYASLEPSVAAFHLAAAPDDALYVSAPTLASRDGIFRIPERDRVEVVTTDFGRPQGLAFRNGALYVTEAAAGWSGVYRVRVGGGSAAEGARQEPGSRIEQIIAGRNLIGLAFHPDGGVVVASNDTVYRFDKRLRV